MDDGEVELSDNVLFPTPNSSSISFGGSESVDSFLDELLTNTRTCTHTHTCNLPGPDATSHTHTCYHTHTQRISPPEDDNSNENNRLNSKPKRPSGNREAVRKYREKKKAHTAYLEEEVQKLRALNQQLGRKVQGHAILEAEVLRLRTLLMDLRGKIDSELGAFPFQKQCSTANVLNDGNCGEQCKTDLPCFHPQTGLQSQPNPGGNEQQFMVSQDGNCQPALVDCGATATDMVNGEEHAMDSVEL